MYMFLLASKLMKFFHNTRLNLFFQTIGIKGLGYVILKLKSVAWICSQFS
jgi:hypothetical protein